MSFSRIALIVAAVAAFMLLVAGPGTRLGIWEYGLGLKMMRWALYGGVAAAALAIVLAVIPKTRRGNGTTLVAALVIGLATAWVPWNGYQTVRSLPFIHDITTDSINPPPFVAVAPLRANASNPLEYPGEETAKMQQDGYPDIRPLELNQTAQQTFDQALQACRSLGWEIVAAVPEEGRIEATDTTFWFGFKDDVVIRIKATDSGSRLDVRSKSRVGRSDVGANAARIRAFFDEFGRRD